MRSAPIIQQGLRTPREFRELLYPWHPWFGLRIDVHEPIERPGGFAFRCTVSGYNGSSAGTSDMNV